ncbi:MAG TPA: superoxide dismutase [Cyanobacteria bacterium UBA8530]|nr:superoxide dismutase [Cyanobacteria bacterium UBA8530]
MKILALISGGILLFASAPIGEAFPVGARAVLFDAKCQKVGEAQFTEEARGVRISLEVSHLAPGLHGIHIHDVGRCDPPDFTTAGAHFNPDGRRHGLLNPQGPHAGDLPNLNVGPDGKAKAEFLAPLVTLGPGPNSLFKPQGTSLVIHSGPDDERSDPAGNSGSRIACGVIERP